MSRHRYIDIDELMDDMKKIRYYIARGENEIDLELTDDEKKALFDYFNDLYDIIGVEVNDKRKR